MNFTPITLTFIFLMLINILVHYLILHKVYFHKLFGRTFGFLWICRQFWYLEQLVILLLGFTYAISINNEVDESSLWHRIAASPSFGCFFANFVNLLISINRACVVAVPLKYKMLFSMKRTRILVAFCAFLTIVVCLPAFKPTCLRMWANPFVDPVEELAKMKESGKTSTNLCNLKEVFEYGGIVLTVGCMMLIDAFTFFRVLWISKERINLNLAGPLKKELKLCNMIVAQQVTSIICSFVLSCFYLLPGLENQKYLFLISWALTSLVDGMVVLIFTPNFFKTTVKKHYSSSVTFSSTVLSSC
ncbi:hypothetical protein L596_012573 [Steinernema carpocapsae]|uniref:7TM GPCR serpentine receptor class x (Srx) domain-containing protein n=1 Tax=Steinernema carpocapsae TaxID=34508 RepID=A0A4U5NYC9_STECR|nr:hypothetical protein L596_012573 [Steinernema carpocapsae]